MNPEEFVSAFVDLTDALVDDFDVFDLLHTLAGHCVSMLGASAAGILLADGTGRPRIAVSSEERAQVLELFQLQSDEGPCLECYRTGRPVSEGALNTANERWPRFAPAAVDAGFVGVHALPMRLREDVIGGLNLFASDGGRLGPEELRLAQGLADAATIAILQDRVARGRELLIQQRQAALDDRIVIEQARGLIAASLRVGTDEALDLLRSTARRTARRIVEVAADVSQKRIDPESLRAG